MEVPFRAQISTTAGKVPPLQQNSVLSLFSLSTLPLMTLSVTLPLKPLREKQKELATVI